jgi:hypothetical protein
MIRATDTMQLHRLYASPALCAAATERADLRVVREPTPMRFDGGRLVDPAPTAVGHR